MKKIAEARQRVSAVVGFEAPERVSRGKVLPYLILYILYIVRLDQFVPPRILPKSLWFY